MSEVGCKSGTRNAQDAVVVRRAPHVLHADAGGIEHSRHGDGDKIGGRKPVVVDLGDWLRYLPCETWLPPLSAGCDDLHVQGVRFRPNTSALRTDCHALVAYRDRPTTVQRLISGHVQQARVGPGDISLKDCRTEGWWAWTETIDVVHVHLRQALLDRVAADNFGPVSGTVRLRDEACVRDARLHRIVEEIVEEASGKRAGSQAMIASLGVQLAILLVRQYGEVVADGNAGGLKADERKRIRAHVSAHLDGDLSVAALAQLVGVSADHFTRLFRASFDCTPHQYVLRARLRFARDMLRDPNRSMVDVAARTGFSDQSHFSRWFKREFGQTPGCWRRSDGQMPESRMS